ncbi:MAG: ABC transporter permease [Anaerovoracaceae bacterium]|nr:ABC transporter permease [Bacillota bacterium]MDY3954428.1 ABC transporter permease [Anaerovoracaceae bacterium]
MANGNAVNEKKEPFVRIIKCDNTPRWYAWSMRAVAIVFALLICAVVIVAITGLNPLEVYKAMFEGAFGTERRIWITLRDMMILLCVGIALAPAFKMKFWNIGAEGQILVGGCATAACMIYLDNVLPLPALFLVMALTSMAAGAVWGLIPAIFKAKLNTNETLFTLMMNYVAIQITSYCVALWENPYGSNTVGIINSQTKAGWFPTVFGQQYALNVMIVLTLALVMYIYLKHSKHGYEITVIGDSENTARYAGIDVAKVIVRTMLVSGAIAGLSGFIAVAGASHTISVNTAGGRGFTAIIVAWLAKFNTFTMIAISFLLVFLQQGACEIASRFNLNDYASQMITGIILFFILGSEFFINYRLVFRGKMSKEA